MNRRIRKKKEKQSLMEYSFEIIKDFSYKKRKRIVDRIWKNYSEANFKILVGYKKKLIEEE